MDTLFVGLIIALAALYIARRMWRAARGTGSCHCGGSCARQGSTLSEIRPCAGCRSSSDSEKPRNF